MNNWYNRLNGNYPVNNPVMFRNPAERMNYIANAMRNPPAFVKEQFPDIPESIQNDPNAILNYLQKTRGAQFTQQMQQIFGMPGGR